MKRGIRIYFYLIITFLIFLVIAIYVPGKGMTNELINTILAVASFIFGVLIAFSIANRHSRLSNIRSSLRQQDAVFLDIYLLSKTFGKKISGEIRLLIDNVLISQIDYELKDISKESPRRVRDVCLFIENLKAKTKIQTEAKDKLMDCIKSLLDIQKEVEYEVKNGMMFYEWISLLLLSSIIIFCLFYINNNSMISIIIVPLLSTSLILLILVLEQLDSLVFQEQNWIWGPLSQLFLELDLLPYFSADIFEEDRLNIKDIQESKKIRVAHYPNQYPDRTGKTIEIVKL